MHDEPRLTEPAPAPEVFAEGFAHAAMLNGVVKLPFFTLVHDETGGERRVVMRLAMPIAGILGVYDALGKLIAQMKEQGVISEHPTC